MKHSSKKFSAVSVTAGSIAVNLVLIVLKLLAGIFAHSIAMLADAAHSCSDIASSVVVIWELRAASPRKKLRARVPTEKGEAAFAIVFAIVLLAAAAIGVKAGVNLFSGRTATLAVPGILAIVAAAVSVVVKEALFHITRAQAARDGGTALMADAWHHRGDALSSLVALAGIIGARCALPLLDSAAAIAVCLFVIKSAYDILADAIVKLNDRECGDEQLEKLRAVISGTGGVLSLIELQARLVGPKLYAEAAIFADSRLSLAEAHAVADSVRDNVRAAFPECKGFHVYVEPFEAADDAE